MEKNLFTIDELKQIRDVAVLLTKKNGIKNGNVHFRRLTDASYELWQVFKEFDGESIYECE